MEIEESFIEYGSGFEKDGVSLEDVDQALATLPQLDDEHGRFFVGVYDADSTEVALGIDKDLMLIGDFSEEESYSIELRSLEESRSYFQLLLEGDIEGLRERLR